jgi:hypothetical protein
MTHVELEPQSSKLTFWILGSVFALLMALGSVLFGGINSSITAVNLKATEAKDLATKHDVQIELLTKQLDKIDSKIDSLLQKNGIKAYFDPSS